MSIVQRLAQNLAIGALALLAASQPLIADPVRWSSMAADSELGFSAYYDGQELSGRFASFTVTLEIDGQTRAPAALRVEVETASADMNDREVNAEIVEPAWFDSSTFPAASYASQDIRPTEDGFVAHGCLHIKGMEQALQIPLEWKQADQTAILSGAVRLSRLNWQVGTGEWSSDTHLSDRVDVRWRVTLVPTD